MKTGNQMSLKSTHEYFQVMYERYHQATAKDKSYLLDEVCACVAGIANRRSRSRDSLPRTGKARIFPSLLLSRGTEPLQNLLLDSLMRTDLVEELYLFFDHLVQIPLSED